MPPASGTALSATSMPEQGRPGMPRFVGHAAFAGPATNGAAEAARAGDGPGADHAAAPVALRHVLHVGCGPARDEKLHPLFRGGTWRETRFDIDPRVRPDVVGSMTDLSAFASGSIDAVWTSHTLEHLYDHEVPVALEEMARVLKPTGFALITTPDLARVAAEIVAGRLEDPLYVAPSGPVTALDVLFGFRRSVGRGRVHMAHRTGFTAERLGRLLVEAGFAEARAWEGDGFDLWAAGLMPAADPATIGLPALP